MHGDRPAYDDDPAPFGGGLPGSDAAVATMWNFANACLDQAIGKVAAIKPQAAFFEQHGPAGMGACRVGRDAVKAGLLVVMDANAVTLAALQPPAPLAGLGMTPPIHQTRSPSTPGLVLIRLNRFWNGPTQPAVACSS